MTRPIKHRIWFTLPDQKPYMEYPIELHTTPMPVIGLNGDLYQTVDEDFVNFTAKPLHIYTSDQYTLMAFTGLTDKNGKEIYEGDIVKCRHFKEDYHVYEVSWGYSGFDLFDPTEEYGYTEEQVEVIGNKFENPDLLSA